MGSETVPVEAELQEQARSTNADVRQRAAVVVSQTMSDADLPLAFELLGDRDWRVRKTIVDGILRNPRDGVMRHLVAALHDPANAGKRNSATEALIRVGEPAVPYVLWELGREADVDVRLALVNLLGDLRNDDGYETLLSLLGRETDINLLSAIVSSLGKYRRDSAIPALLKTLQAEDLWLKFHVIEALGEIGDRAALPSILPLYAEKSLRKPILEAVGRIGDVGAVGFLLRVVSREEKLNLTALRALIRIAESPRPRMVEQTERMLIQGKFRDSFPHDKIVPLVEHLYSTPKRDVKNFILKILGWSGDERALTVLLDSIEEPESAEVSARALLDFGPAAANAVLNKLRATDEDEITALLLRVVQGSSGAEALPTIINFLDHDNPMIRRLAIEILGVTPSPASVDYLLAKLDDRDSACQQAAVEAVTRLVSNAPVSKPELLAKLRKLLASPSIPVKVNSLSVYVNVQGEGYDQELLLASKDSDPLIRQKAVSLMGRYSEEHFGDHLVLALADESTTVRLAAIQSIVALRPAAALQPLVSSLDDDDIWIRAAAAQALGEYRDPVAVRPLIRHLRRDVTPVRIAAIEALGKLDDPAVAPALLFAVEEPDSEIQRAAILALARLDGEAVVQKLLRAARSDDWRLRAAAATSLGRRGEPRGLSELHRLITSDPDTYVQQSAVQALEGLADRSSFDVLFGVLGNTQILDAVFDLFVKRSDLFREQLERAWQHANSRHERIIAAILQAIRDSAIREDEHGR